MKIPVEDIWMCPVNVGAHWILVVCLNLFAFYAVEYFMVHVC